MRLQWATIPFLGISNTCIYTDRSFLPEDLCQISPRTGAMSSWGLTSIIYSLYSQGLLPGLPDDWFPVSTRTGARSCRGLRPGLPGDWSYVFPRTSAKSSRWLVPGLPRDWYLIFARTGVVPYLPGDWSQVFARTRAWSIRGLAQGLPGHCWQVFPRTGTRSSRELISDLPEDWRPGTDAWSSRGLVPIFSERRLVVGYAEDWSLVCPKTTVRSDQGLVSGLPMAGDRSSRWWM